MIFDTDVLIWAARGRDNAIRMTESALWRAISVVTYMELLRGVRDKRELKETHNFISRFDLEILPLSESIGARAASFIEQFTLKSGLSVADALIAATAVHHGQTLCTANLRHFKIIPTLDVSVFRP